MSHLIFLPHEETLGGHGDSCFHFVAVQGIVIGVPCIEIQTRDTSSAQSHGPSDVIEHLFLN